MLHVHPTKETEIEPPVFWWRAAADQAHDEQDANGNPGKKQRLESKNERERLSDVAKITGGICRGFKPFAWPEPDEPRFRTAALPQETDVFGSVNSASVPAEPSAACVCVCQDLVQMPSPR